MYIIYLIVIILIFLIFNNFFENYDNYGKQLKTCLNDDYNQASCINELNENELNTRFDGMEFNKTYNKFMPIIYPFVPKKNSNCNGLKQEWNDGKCNSQCNPFGYQYYRSDLNGCVNKIDTSDGYYEKDNWIRCIPSYESCSNNNFRDNCKNICTKKESIVFNKTNNIIEDSIIFNKAYNIIEDSRNTILGWCGENGGCGIPVGTYPKKSDYYIKNREACEWYFVPEGKNLDYNSRIKYGDVFSIVSKKNGYFLVTCDDNNCGSSAYLSVSVNRYTGPSNIFSGNAQYWKFESLEGKKGNVNLKDKFRIINLYGNKSSLNTCGHYNCGGTYYDGYGVNTAKINSSNYLGDTSKWKIKSV